MPKKITMIRPPTMGQKFKTSAAGFLPGLVAGVAAIPNMIGEMSSQASKQQADLYDEYSRNDPFEQRMREKYGKVWDNSNLIHKPHENPFQGRFFPTRAQGLEALKNSPLGQMLPEGALDRTGPVESHVDNAALGMLTMALGGGAKTLPEIGVALRNAFLPAVGGETGRSFAEGAKFGEGGQIAGDVIGTGLGMLGNLGIGKVARAIPGAATKFGKKAIESTVPGAKQFGQAFSEEEKQVLAEHRKGEKALAAQTKENKKLIEQFGKSDVGARQEERAYLEREQKATETKIAEAEVLKEEISKFNEEAIAEKSKIDAGQQKGREKQLTKLEKDKLRLRTQLETVNAEADAAASAGDAKKYQDKIQEASKLEKERIKANEESIGEQSKLDATKQKQRDKLSNEVDKFQAKNDDIMSIEDAKALKEKIANGEAIDMDEVLNQHAEKMKKNATNIANDIQDIYTFEDLVAEKFGMKPKQLKEKINGHFKRFKESTPIGSEVSAHELEAVHKYIEDEFLGQHELDVPSHNTVRRLISNNRKMIKNGKISVRDVSDILKNTNEVLKDVNLTRGELLNAEKLVNKPLYEAVDKTMNMAKKAYPELKLDDWHQGRKLTRNLYSTQEAAAWVNDTASKGNLPYLNRWLRQPAEAFLKNPEVRRYWLKATEEFAAGNAKAATNNLVAANKLAGKVYEKETKGKSAKAVSALPKKGSFKKITLI
jgi:hypothetical protein